MYNQITYIYHYLKLCNIFILFTLTSIKRFSGLLTFARATLARRGIVFVVFGRKCAISCIAIGLLSFTKRRLPTEVFRRKLRANAIADFLMIIFGFIGSSNIEIFCLGLTSHHGIFNASCVDSVPNESAYFSFMQSIRNKRKQKRSYKNVTP